MNLLEKPVSKISLVRLLEVYSMAWPIPMVFPEWVDQKICKKNRFIKGFLFKLITAFKKIILYFAVNKPTL